MVRTDRQEEGEARADNVTRVGRRFVRIKQEIGRLKALNKALADAPDGQISLTDPDARAMATTSRNSGIVGYNVRTAVDAETHHIVTHEVTESTPPDDQPAVKNVWPAPSASGIMQITQSVCTNVSGMSARRPLLRWRLARHNPHKVAGLSAQFCAGGFRNADQLSGHLLFATRSLLRQAGFRTNTCSSAGYLRHGFVVPPVGSSRLTRAKPANACALPRAMPRQASRLRSFEASKRRNRGSRAPCGDV